MRALISSLVLVLLSAAPALAAGADTGLSKDPLISGILSTVIYSAVGIAMAFIAYKVIDLLTPGNLGKDIANNNIALAVLAGFTMLGVCIIIAAVLVS